MIRKIVITVMIIFVLIFTAAIIIPIIYKDKIVEIAKTEINNNVNANVDFGDFGLSIIKNFPNVTFTMKDLKVDGIDEFKGITLADIGEFNITIDLMSIIGGETIQVIAFNLKKANIHVLVTKEGKANWDIAKESESTAEEVPGDDAPAEFKIGLKKYSLDKTNIIYDDREGDMLAKVFGMNHTGNGDFTQDLFSLDTRTKIDKLTFRFEGINYLHKVNTDIKATLQMDMVNSKYTFEDNEFRLNNLFLGLDGHIAMPGDDIEMDVNFEAKKTEFKNILSLVPAVFMNDFGDIKTTGKFGMAGFVRGISNDEKIPGFLLEMVVEDGMFKYPDLPVAINNVNIDLRAANKDGDPDHSEVDIRKFHFELDKEPFDFSLKLRTPVSDPDINATIKGVIDLTQLGKAIPFDGISELSGIINANASAKGKLSALDRGQYDRFYTSGNILIKEMVYGSNNLPEKVELKSMELTFNPKHVGLNDFNMMMGKSDFRANGALDNLLGYMLNDEALKGSLNFNSSYMNLNDLIPDESDSENNPAEDEMSTSTSDEMFELPENLDLTLTSNLKKVIYEKTELDNINGVIQLSNAMLKGRVSLSSNYINIDDFMEEEDESPPGSGSDSDETTYTADDVFKVPGNMSFTMEASIKKVHYDNMDMENVVSVLTIRNETVSFKQLKADLLGGSIVITGSYSTKKRDKPEFSFGYKIKDFDIQKSFQTFNTMEKIAPASKFIAGSFSSDMSLKGLLGYDMFPDYPSLTGNGMVYIPDGTVKNFEPTNKLAEAFKIEQLKEFKLKETRAYFSFKDGRVYVEPFDVTEQGIKMTVSGSHGFDETIDYLLKVDVPRKLMGAAANQLMDRLLGKIKGTGIDMGQQENIKLNIRYTGTLTNPKIESGLGKGGKEKKKDVKEKAKEEAERLKKEAAERAKQEADRLKKEAKERAAKEKDRLKQEAERKKKEAAEKARREAERLKKEAEEKAKKEAERKKKEAEEKLKKEAEEKLKKKFKF